MNDPTRTIKNTRAAHLSVITQGTVNTMRFLSSFILWIFAFFITIISLPWGNDPR